jgi:hypothetical protein
MNSSIASSRDTAARKIQMKARQSAQALHEWAKNQERVLENMQNSHNMLWSWVDNHEPFINGARRRKPIINILNKADKRTNLKAPPRYIYRGMTSMNGYSIISSYGNERWIQLDISSWTTNPLFATAWVAGKPGATILRMRLNEQIPKLLIGKVTSNVKEPPKPWQVRDNNSVARKALLKKSAYGSEVIVKPGIFDIVKEQMNIPITRLTGVTANGVNHKHLPGGRVAHLNRSTRLNKEGKLISSRGRMRGLTPKVVYPEHIPKIDLIDVKVSEDDWTWNTSPSL